MFSSLAFTPCGVLPSRTSRAPNGVNNSHLISISMRGDPSSSQVSRRQLGQLVIGVSAAAIAYTATSPVIREATAEAKKRPPPFVKDETGISYYDVKQGTGYSPAEGDFVVLDYMGQRQVIPGLESAVATMKTGGERKVIVPAKLAYGDKGVCLQESEECLVPPGETLGFSVTLLRVAIPPT